MSSQSSSHPEPPRPKSGGTNKRPRPFELWGRYEVTWGHMKGKMSAWHRIGRYRKENERQQALDHMKRQYAGIKWKWEFSFEEPKKKGHGPW